ncbi:expressed unknown protein [Seminavis robusta]|uniref:Arylsulfatase n=1 Tax=Seminavis robusta TaxID=568900 RepID=A0A9N8EHD6_9STRA|nr:expressed unknown protein [Seminavis robusta]|eukprot:Sro1209_g252630.1 n/a (272) ;mRNA; r:9432-10247
MKIAFLHTLSSNQALFTPYTEDLQRKRPGVTTTHHVDEDLLKNARKIASEEDRARVTTQVHQALSSMIGSGANVDFVVCTCSTIGDMAERYTSSAPVLRVDQPMGLRLGNPSLGDDAEQTTSSHIPVLRVDRPMADCAVGYSVIHVLAALESTLEPTKELLDKCASTAHTHPRIHMTVVPEAWSHFQQGDQKAYIQTIADYIQEKYSNTESSQDSVIVLAQASMSPAAELLLIPEQQSSLGDKDKDTGMAELPRILTSPSICVDYLAGLRD